MFNRALYGNNSDFRMETSDLPEFGFYNSGMSGNLHFALERRGNVIELNKAQKIECRYQAGQRIYRIQDPLLLDKGTITLTAVARYDTDGAVFRFECQNLPEDTKLISIYGGARGKKFSRNGDLGVDPQDAFSLKKDYCLYNRYEIKDNRFLVHYSNGSPISDEMLLQSDKSLKHLCGLFPVGSQLGLDDASQQEPIKSSFSKQTTLSYPLLKALTSLPSNGQLSIGIRIIKEDDWTIEDATSLERAYQQACNEARKIASRLRIQTPDPFINAIGQAIAMAADGIWQDPVYQHGAIGWRMPLAGWRGAYTADVLGWHDRARTHFKAYSASQMTCPTDKPVIMDSALNIARSAKIAGTPMYSNGYIARTPNNPNTMNHYDMNLCYIDELLWHFRWTGDTAFVREMWPVLTRHLAWEKRCFDADNDGLYDAYCCIWASDALQYSGGGVTHSSAYNYCANQAAAELAVLIGQDPEPYRREAEKILKAINQTLWLPSVGHWAEYQDFLGNKLIHPDAGIWTIYHAIDSKINDAFQGYQALRYIDTEIPHIPVRIKDNKGYAIEKDLQTVSSSDWQPYIWSVNNVAFAEVMHTALAYFSGGRPQEGYRLLKANIMDGMYLGASPGNVGQVSFYDASRGECYRDFADAVGIYSRTVVQGLFGIQPDLLNNQVVIRPGFPQEWDRVDFEIPDVSYRFRREKDGKSQWLIEPRFAKNINVLLEIPIQREKIRRICVNNQEVKARLITESIGLPYLQISCGMADRLCIDIEESGQALADVSVPSSPMALGEELHITMPAKTDLLQIKDPQQILQNSRFSATEMQATLRGECGHRCFFVQVRQGDQTWWQAIPVQVVAPWEIVASEENHSQAALCFCLRNNTRKASVVDIQLNGQTWKTKLSVPAKSQTTFFRIEAPMAVHGSNTISIKEASSTLCSTRLFNWNIPFHQKTNQRQIDLSRYFNDKVRDIFQYGKYMSPRSPYTTLQIPTQGYGDWCQPMALPKIDDRGLRAASKNGLLTVPQGIVFATPSDSTADNVVFVSQWDNFPNRLQIPLKGKASHAYLLMAGSTNHMQFGMVNGRVIVQYQDSSTDTLDLINPDTWAAIEQDYYTDDLAYRILTPRPYRVQLSTGWVSREMSSVLSQESHSRDMSPALSPATPGNRKINGGAGVILDLPLQPEKRLKSIHIESLTNESIIGLLSLTLIE